MIDNRAEFEGLNVWQHVAGSSVGGWSDREMAAAILRTLDCLGHNREADRGWRDLATDSDDEIDVDHYTRLLVDVEHDHLPPYCGLWWEDNELVVRPSIVSVECDVEAGEIGTADGLPADDDGETINPDDLPFFLVVNDHGNATLYQWQTHTSPPDWAEVWGLV